MLVLSRKLNEAVMIGDDIEVIVLGTEGDTVKLGIRAPRDVDIYRKEIYDAIRSANKEAASHTDSLAQIRAWLEQKRDPS